MLITYKTIRRIDFPVFKLPTGNWQTVDGLVFLDTGLLDDRNMEGTTLGARRLQTHQDGLITLRKCITSHIGILKQNSLYFIDNHGKTFIYEKTKMCPLKYYKIKKVEQKETGSLLWVRDVKTPFPIPRPPYDGMSWAGLLHLHGLPWLLYEYSEEKRKNSRRKI
jgi:hypothetical protein